VRRSPHAGTTNLEPRTTHGERRTTNDRIPVTASPPR
jgi:hypothetical protein